RMAANPSLVNVVKKFVESDPAAVARILGASIEADAVDVLNNLPATPCAEVLTRLQPTYTIALLKKAHPDFFTGVVQKLDPQRVSEILLSLPEETRQSFLGQLTEKSKRQIEEMLQYPEDSAGRLMTPDYFAFHVDLTVRDVIQKIRTIVRKQITFT